jgi:leucyl aminopeptidase
MSPVFSVRTTAADSAGWTPLRGDALVVFVRASKAHPPRVAPEIQRWLAGLGATVTERLARAEAKGTVGEITTIEVEPPDGLPRTVHLVGAGRGDADAVRRAGAAAARRTRSAGTVVVSAELPPASVEALVEGWSLASYRFTRRSAEPPPSTREVTILAARSAAPALRTRLAGASHRAAAVRLARDLANTPSNEKSPSWMVEQAVGVAERAGLTCDVLAGDDLEAGGFGGVLAVGQGSASPPNVVRLGYVPKRSRADAPHLVLVGKGITYDSGGLSLKPADAMTMMKTDMAGAAAVLGCMAVLADLGVKARVTALIALAENMPSAAAFRPGDVVTHVGGRTSEIVNTDAEGRLVLADLLAYADRELAPDAVVDIATLTGAASVGLGRIHGALYSNRAELSRALAAAGRRSGESVWPMPLVEEYRPSLDSSIADLRHVGDASVQGGSITAALFLKEFVGDRPWAHLDIAGPGRSDADRHEVSRGATGYGVRLLLAWLQEAGAPRRAAGRSA